MTLAALPARVARGVARAVRARPGRFAAIAVGVLTIQIALPPLVLSLARKPIDFATINPWLVRLPEYLVANVPSSEKASKIWNLALFWFSSSNPYGIEWGFAVDVGDLARMTATALLVAAYFALVDLRRATAPVAGAIVVAPHVVRSPGALGVVAAMLGLSTGPCSVMGCGAPVLPVVGLAFAGLSSTTLVWLARMSTWATTAVLLALVIGVGGLAWSVGAPRGLHPRSPS